MTRIILENYKCPSWNVFYAGKHWSTRQEMKEEALFAVMEALNNKKLTVSTAKVRITVVAYLKRVIDPDNVCEKMIIDGLKKVLFKDDSAKYVECVTTKVQKSDKDFTEIVVE